MSNIYKHINLLVIAIFALWLMPSCSADEELFSETNGKETVVMFRPSVANSLPTRAVSDGKSVDWLIVKVYDKDGNHLDGQDKEMSLSDAQTSGVPLTLIDGKNYKVLFFAFDKDNTAYTLNNDGNLSVDYTDYLNAGFAGMEQLDVFCTVHELTATEGATPSVTLTRPTAQLNFVDATIQPRKDVHRAVVTLKNIPTTLNLLTGETSENSTETTFTFADYATEGEQGETVPVTVDGAQKNAWYVSTNYVLAPASGNISISATIDLQTAEGESLKQHTVEKILLEKNKRTNVLGNIVMEPVTVSEWDGIELKAPQKDEQNRYIISEASELAWLKDNGNTLAAGTFLLTTDIDMVNYEITSLQIPAGSTIIGDGKVRTIKNLNLTNGGLFGDATNLSVSNLNIEDITVNSTANTTTHVGALVNTLTGNGTFTNVTVKNASVSTTNGAAGGIVGYVVRNSEKDLNEKLAVTFDNCHVESNAITGTMSEGHFVGLLSGYDNGETLTFNASCSVTAPKKDVNSYYTESNKACFISEGLSAYNGWVGRENYYRGIVKFGETRYIPKWDGTTKVEPLKINDENNKYNIYSAFDLAYLQGQSPTNVVFKENVDLGGDRDLKINPYTPIEQVTTLLDGGIYDANGVCTDEYTIYNLYIEETKEWTGFIREAKGGTHKNLTFENSSIIVHYISTEKQDMGYAGTLTPYVNGATSYIVEIMVMSSDLVR